MDQSSATGGDSAGNDRAGADRCSAVSLAEHRHGRQQLSRRRGVLHAPGSHGYLDPRCQAREVR